MISEEKGEYSDVEDYLQLGGCVVISKGGGVVFYYLMHLDDDVKDSK